MLLLSVVVVYVVDISGFTESWRDGLARLLKVRTLRPLHPFDCGQCMTWWSTLILCICEGELSLPTIAVCALLSLLSNPIGQLLIFMRESLNQLINKIMP